MSLRARSLLAALASLVALGTSPVVRAESTSAAKGPVVPPAVKPAKPSAAEPAPKTVAKPTRRASRAAKRTEHTGPVATMPGFTMRADGTSVIFVDLTAPPQVEEHAGKGFVTYVLKGTQVDRANNKNPLETAFYDTPVLRARLRGIPKEDDAELQIELRADVKPTFKVLTEKGQSRLEVVFPAGKFARADFDHELPRHHTDRAPREDRAPRKGKKHAPASTSTGAKGDEGRKGPKAP